MSHKPSPITEAEEDDQEKCDEVKAALEKKCGRTFPELSATKVRMCQKGTGFIYYIKAYVGNNEYVHLQIKETMSGGSQLLACQLDKTYQDVLDVFS